MPGGSSVRSSQDVPGMVRYPRCPRILCQGCLVYGHPRMFPGWSGIPAMPGGSSVRSSQDVPGMVRYP